MKNTNGRYGQCPCPSGYKVPAASHYSAIKSATEKNTLFTYGGYVYDDSCPVENTPFGWQWDSEGNAVIDETIDCNPAKGTLMVRSTGEPVNLFFSYGKAVMTEHGSAAEDTGIDEIGIGYLGGGRLLYNTAHRYGAFYWSGSGDSHADTNMLFIDFWYSLNTNVPINVGTLNTNNGMFVRCVRSEK